MNIGVRAHDLNVTEVSDIIAICKKHNINGLQLVINKTWEDLYNQRNISEIVSRVKSLQEAGIIIFLLGTYFNPVHPNSNSVNEGLDKVKFNIEVAKKCGLKYLGSETGSVNGDSWTYNKENHNEVNFQKVIEVFLSFKMNLVKSSKKFLIEAVYDHVIYDGNRLCELLENINSKNYRVTFDLVNLLNIKNYMDYEKITDEFLKNHSQKIKLIHLKNFVIEDDKKVLCKLEEGFMDYEIIIKLLKKYSLTDIPCIIEELEDDNLFESVEYIHKLWRNNGL